MNKRGFFIKKPLKEEENYFIFKSLKGSIGLPLRDPISLGLKRTWKIILDTIVILLP